MQLIMNSIAAIVITLLPVSLVLAQDTISRSPTAPGVRVRFTVADVRSPGPWDTRRMTLRGTVAEDRSDSLFVRLGGGAGVASFSRDGIGDLSVSRGMQRSWRNNRSRAAVGVLLVASNALLLSQVVRTSRATGRASATMPFAVASVGMTAMTVSRFAFTKTEQWQPVQP